MSLNARASAFGTLAMLLLLGGECRAGDGDDLEALALADQTPEVAHAKIQDWAILCEATAGWNDNNGNSLRIGEQRLSCDASFNKTISPQWQLVFGNRLDITWEAGQHQEIDTLREAYVDWRLDDSLITDAGRINQKMGVAFGYNPTDFFKTHSIRDVLSVSPDSLRSNRLGTLMLRGQALWADGSVSALVAPKVADTASDGPFNPDFGATNDETRWMIFGNERITSDIAPQWILFGGDRSQPQIGTNVTALLNKSTVAYLEWAGGHERAQYAQANNLAGNASFQNRFSAGLTYTATEHVSLTFEYEYNGAALSKAAERRSIATDPYGYLNYLGYASQIQELPTRQALFAYASFSDLVIHKLSLNVFERFAPADSSRATWGQLIYKAPRFDVTVERLLDSGGEISAYGNTSGSPRLQVTFACYF